MRKVGGDIGSNATQAYLVSLGELLGADSGYLDLPRGSAIEVVNC